MWKKILKIAACIIIAGGIAGTVAAALIVNH